MLRTDGDPEQRAFDPAIRFLHWLTLFLVAALPEAAFTASVGVIIILFPPFNKAFWQAAKHSGSGSDIHAVSALPTGRQQGVHQVFIRIHRLFQQFLPACTT